VIVVNDGHARLLALVTVRLLAAVLVAVRLVAGVLVEVRFAGTVRLLGAVLATAVVVAVRLAAAARVGDRRGRGRSGRPARAVRRLGAALLVAA
jgi:hypothetical protein